MGFGVSATDSGYGYGLNVAKLLAGPYRQFYSKALAGGLATVQHAGGPGLAGFGVNGGSSANGVECVDTWLGTSAWDVVTINFGLHDCDPATSGYAANIERILKKAREAAGTVIFVTTTPFHRYHTYNYTCVVESNKQAAQVIAKLNGNGTDARADGSSSSSPIRIADLFAFVERYCGSNYTSCPIQLDNNLHFATAWTPPFLADRTTGEPLQTGPRPSGQQYTSLAVAQSIQRALPQHKIQPPINATASVWATEAGLDTSELGAPDRLQVLPAGSNCGLPPSTLNTSLPNVLIIGDSVSDSGSGYGPNVRDILELDVGTAANPRNNGPLAIVQHNGGWSPAKGANEQASSSQNGVACIDYWLGQGFKWQVVSMNFGIHDCWKAQFVNATAYRSNIEYIYSRIHASLAEGGKVVWTSTTPIAKNCSKPNEPRGPCYGVDPQCVADYNRIAFDVLGSKEDIVVNDVYAAVLEVCGADFQTCSLQHEHDVHPSGPGKQFLAIELAATIAPLLGKVQSNY